MIYPRSYGEMGAKVRIEHLQTSLFYLHLFLETRILVSILNGHGLMLASWISFRTSHLYPKIIYVFFLICVLGLTVTQAFPVVIFEI